MRLLCCSLVLVGLVACGSAPQRTAPGSALRPPPSEPQPKPEPEKNQINDDELTQQLGNKTSNNSNGSSGSSGGFIMSNQPPQPPAPQRTPPQREPPPSSGSNNNTGGFVLAPQTPPPSSSSDPDVEKARAVLVAAAFEKALNASDTSGAEKLSSSGCWAKECASIARQAQTKFKVKLLPGVSQVGTRGLAEMDVLCGGTRQCDKVWLLLEKDCMSGTRFVVSDVTEDKSKRDGWLRNAPSACGGSSTASSTTPPTTTTSTSSASGDVKTGSVSATRTIPDADRVIAGLRPRLRMCFNNGLKADPKMSGRVTYTVAVAGDGTVTTANVANNSGVPFDVVTCQVGVLKRASFTAPGGSGSTLSIPIILSAP